MIVWKKVLQTSGWKPILICIIICRVYPVCNHTIAYSFYEKVGDCWWHLFWVLTSLSHIWFVPNISDNWVGKKTNLNKCSLETQVSSTKKETKQQFTPIKLQTRFSLSTLFCLSSSFNVKSIFYIGNHQCNNYNYQIILIFN